MKKLIRETLSRFVGRFGYELTLRPERREFPIDLTESEIAIWRQVHEFTMTSIESVVSLVRAVEYLIKNNIPGDFIECGVWRGGSSMAIALTLARLSQLRDIHLFDTFEGFPQATEYDKNWKNETAEDRRRSEGENWGRASLEDVQTAMKQTNYPAKNTHYVKGLVENTIPDNAPESIALLRLDTDFYKSTLHELTHLYPRLSRGGILIIDDYGDWQGCRKAVDEYFQGRVHLSRIEPSGRLLVKSD